MGGRRVRVKTKGFIKPLALGWMYVEAAENLQAAAASLLENETDYLELRCVRGE
jgi:hypothetical protein